MYAAALLGVLVTMVIELILASRGPTVFDRILAVNTFGTMTILLIALCGYHFGRPDFMDLALIYALLNFIGSVAVAKFSRFGNLARDHRRHASGEDPNP
ncbi:monovalent cation/H+ antiporter complex subunit F [Myxococcota bacterium]|nr:monovalent cation/H+ antiporter complex subunit F [Myxococcota bacterium]